MGNWQIDSNKNKTAYCIATVEEGILLKHRSPEETKTNAEFIVEACNNYERLKTDNEMLLNALKNLLQSYTSNTEAVIAKEVIKQLIKQSNY